MDNTQKISFTLDGKKVSAKDGETIWQAAARIEAVQEVAAE